MKKWYDNENIWLWASLIIVIIGCIVSSDMDANSDWVTFSLVFGIPLVFCFIRLNAIGRKLGFIPNMENIEYCPRCKSKHIKVYRETVDSLYDVGVRYTNRTRCRCMRCGKDWGTIYDYRFIHKR